ncbi:DMT family transporter [Ramlibacter sp. AN1015]|uniref:DMT family transporter n=1 Tax=Ramlibacter sp. AN1015 TaxID=3133428 RepID=UPI0030C4059C
MLRGVLAGLAAGALWGLVFVVPRVLAQFSPVDLASGRLAAYGFVATAAMVLGLRVQRLPTPAQALAAFGLSVLGFWGYYLLLVLAIRDAGVEVPTLVIGTIPLWVMLLGKPGHLRWTALLPGLLLTALGLALMVRAQHPELAATAEAGVGAADAPHYARGLALAVAAMASWTAFALLNAAWLKRHPEVNATEWTNWLGVATGIGATGLWLIAGSSAAEIAAQPQRGLFVTLCLATGFGSAWLATVLWTVASRRLSPSLCGQLIVSETLFALLYSYAWDARWPTAAQSVAAVLFTLGILASIRAHR